MFDKAEQERQRQRCADSISKLLHPKTQQLFSDLKNAGGFPRRATFRRHTSSVEPRFSARVMEPPAAAEPMESARSRGTVNFLININSSISEFALINIQ